MHGLRSFKWRDEKREVLDQVCVYDAEKRPAKPRDLDGLWQHQSFFDHSRPEQDKEEVLVTPDDTALHLVAADADACVWAPFHLPAVALGQSGSGLTGVQSTDASWGVEMFLWEGAHRWSASASWSRATGDLTRVVAVQEVFTDIRPSTPNVLQLTAGKVPPPRDSLDPDEMTWLSTSARGQATGWARASDGRHLARVHGHTEVAWTAPSPDLHPANCTLLLPDAMYLSVPLSLGMLPGADHTGCRLEFGGAMHADAPSRLPQQKLSRYQDRLHKTMVEEQEAQEDAAAEAAAVGHLPVFQRLVLDYNKAGLLEQVVAERYLKDDQGAQVVLDYNKAGLLERVLAERYLKDDQGAYVVALRQNK